MDKTQSTLGVTALKGAGAVGAGVLLVTAGATIFPTEKVVENPVNVQLQNQVSDMNKQLNDVNGAIDAAKAETVAAKVSLEEIKAKQMSDAQIIADYKAELEKVKAEAASQPKTVEVVTTVNGELTSLTDQYWVAKTSSNMLEIGEDVDSITGFIGDSELDSLSDGEISNAWGTFDYTQELEFTDAFDVNVYENDENDVADFIKIADNENYLTYRVEFPDALEVEVDSSSPYTIDGLEGKKLTLLGKTYDVVTARSDSTGKKVEMTLMTGAVKDTITQGETKIYSIDGKDVTVTLEYVGETSCKFKINDAYSEVLEEAETDKVAGYTLGVKEIMPEEAGELVGDKVEFFLGANKLVLSDNDITSGTSTADLEINGETMDDVAVLITGTKSGSTLYIDSMSLAYTANDDLYIGKGQKLSDVLEQPESLLNVDIRYGGLSFDDSQDIKIEEEDDDQYVLSFDVDSGSVELPLTWNYGTASGLGLGKENKGLVLNPYTTVVQPDQYFILTPGTIGKDTKTQVLQYLSADDNATTTPVIKLKDLATGQTLERPYDITARTASLKLGGTDYTIYANSSVGVEDFNISIGTSGGLNGGVIVTSYGAKITLAGAATNTANFSMNITEVDTDMVEGTGNNLVFFTDKSTSTATQVGDITFVSGLTLLQSSENDDEYFAYTRYGAKLTKTSASDSLKEYVIEWPKSQIGPIVYIDSKIETKVD